MDIPGGYLWPGSVARILFTVIALLLCAHLAGLSITYLTGGDYYNGFVPHFDFDTEGNIPTFFSASLFLISASLFFITGKASRFSGEKQPAWFFLSVLFCFLAVDESASIHEEFIEPVRATFDASGPFYFAWIIPYGIATMLVAIFFFRTFYQLQSGLRRWFALSAAAYLVGAIGFEMLGGMHFEMLNGKPDLQYGLIITFEELFEMTGLALLVYALLLLLERRHGGYMLMIATNRDIRRGLQLRTTADAD